MSSLRKALKQSRAFASLEQETYLNLLRTAGVLEGPFEHLFKSHDMSQPLYNVLRILRGQKDMGPQNLGLPCSHISERMVARGPDITRLVDKLIRMDLARRRRSDTDRRVVLISITSKGIKALAKLEQPVNDLERESLGHLSAQELKELNKLLVKARKSD